MTWRTTLDGQVALVTGGAERVGAGIARALAEAGADVAVNHLDRATAASTAVEAISETGRRGAAFEADVSSAAAVAALVDDVVDTFGRLDIVIHNASSFVRAPFLQLTETDFEASVGVGLRGPLFLSQAAAKVMIQQGGGKIIALIGNSLYESWPDYVTHSVCKAALARLMEILSVTLSPTVQCLAIAPNQVLWASELHDKHRRAKRESTAAGRYEILAPDNIRVRTGTVEDVAQMIVMLCKAGPYLNGAVIPLDGGMSRY
jgi:NAD(P)-dependent dehydrogenase (short-subunit alcohol dehydrogenase family)